CCMDSSSESWEPLTAPHPWHSRAGWRSRPLHAFQSGATLLVHNDARAGSTVQQPLEVKAGELIFSVRAHMCCKGSHRIGIAGFQLGKRREIIPCRGIFILLAA